MCLPRPRRSRSSSRSSCAAGAARSPIATAVCCRRFRRPRPGRTWRGFRSTWSRSRAASRTRCMRRCSSRTTSTTTRSSRSWTRSACSSGWTGAGWCAPSSSRRSHSGTRRHDPCRASARDASRQGRRWPRAVEPRADDRHPDDHGRLPAGARRRRRAAVEPAQRLDADVRFRAEAPRGDRDHRRPGHAVRQRRGGRLRSRGRREHGARGRATTPKAAQAGEKPARCERGRARDHRDRRQVAHVSGVAEDRRQLLGGRIRQGVARGRRARAGARDPAGRLRTTSMSSVALFRDYELPWTPSEEEQRRLRRILGAVLGLFIAFGVIIPLLPAPPKSTAPPVLPERVVEFLLERPKPRPVPPPKVETPKPAQLELPKLETPVVKPPPPEPKLPPKEQPKPDPKQKAASTGLLALSQQLAELRQLDVNTRTDAKALNAGVGEKTRVDRALLTAKVGEGSGGIAVSATSSGFGGGSTGLK